MEAVEKTESSNCICYLNFLIISCGGGGIRTHETFWVQV